MLQVGDLKIGSGMPKICASITEEDQKSVIAAADIIVQRHVDFVEWRIDFFKRINDADVMTETLRRLHMSLMGTPLLITYRSKAEGGTGELGRENIRKILMEMAHSPYVDMVDVEVFSGTGFETSIEQFGESDYVNEEVKEYIRDLKKYVKVVGSYHDFNGTPSEKDIVTAVNYIYAAGADMPKVAFMPHDNKDVLSLMTAVNTVHDSMPEVPVIAMSMGKIGTISRIACESYGCSVTFASAGQSSAPGQMEINRLRDMIEMLHSIR